MSDFDETTASPAAVRPVWVKRPRISGTAMVGGLHLSSGNYGTAPPWQLALTGLGMAAALGGALVLTYLELALLERASTTDFAAGLAQPLLSMLNFLIVLRLSPLSGYHAAEHKVVAAVEAYGDINYDQVVEMPRAHPRCGTVLLFGILPTLMIAIPLWRLLPPASIAVAVLGWMVRYHVGYFVQQYFTTKPPTPNQLRAGIAAGEKLLRYWEADPDRRVSIARNIWTRGMPQMLAGMFLGYWLLTQLGTHLHYWLDY